MWRRWGRAGLMLCGFLDVVVPLWGAVARQLLVSGE